MENLLFLGVPILKHIRVDPDEGAHDEMIHLDQNCLFSCLSILSISI